MAVHVMTDKKVTKQLPCTYPGCPDEVVVNKFYTPAKARCPAHSGKTTPAVRLAVGPVNDELESTEPNHSLGQLCCPLCREPMEIVHVDEELGWPSLRCPSPCSTLIRISPQWGALKVSNIRNLPEPLRGLIEALNIEQRAKRKTA